MRTVLKKNQIIVFVIGLMIIAAGYLNFTNGNNLETGKLTDSEELASIGDAKLVSGEAVDVNNTVLNNISNSISNEISSTEENTNTLEDDSQENIIANEIETSSQITESDDYFTRSKLERETMYSQRIESYQDILSNTNVSEAQKKTAQEEINKINNEQNAIMICENLIKTKGIKDLVIFVNGDSINVIVKGESIEKDEIAQIQNIVTREMEADIGNIHIMNK